MKPRIKIIAEAGVNHNGDLNMALDLVNAAAETGADVVKFQTFRAEEEISRNAPKADYQMETTHASESQFEMVRKLELGPEEHKIIVARCREKNIEFLSSPFDIPSIILLCRDLGLTSLKIPSGEITHAPYLFEAAKSGCQLILSTGMSTLEEIKNALSIIALGLSGSEGPPSMDAAFAAFSHPKNQAALFNKVTLLHCTTEYPAPIEDVNLRAMNTLRDTFGLAVGYSDHTSGIEVPIAAAARGAHIIEKHFTLDKNLPGPDHKASLEPGLFAEMVRGIRNIELALGDGTKKPAPSELKNIPIARKSLVAKALIKAGDSFSKEVVGVKRPGTGISPMDYWEIMGKVSSRNYEQDELIDQIELKNE
jgi:N-acetylneuraminate synthase